MSTNTKPNPVYIKAGEKKIASAYANRPPTQRKPDWSWKMRFTGPCGTSHTISLGRCPIHEVSDKMMRRLQTRGLVHHQYDFSELDTVGNLMRAWYENAVVHADISPRTKELYKSGAKSIVELMDRFSLSMLSSKRIMLLREELFERYASTTVHAKLQTLQFAIAWGRRMKINIPEFKFVNKRGKPKEKYTPTNAELGRVLGQIKDLRLAVAVYLASATGGRVGEIMKLKKSDFVKRKGYGKVLLDGKTGPRWVTINKCNWMVIQYAIHDFAENLFEGLSASNLSTKLSKISESLGFRFTFQALRRLRSKTLVMKGLPIKRYQKEMGHSYKTAIEHYLRYSPEEVLEML